METNKIYHGDCYRLIKDIPDQSVDCVYTDVPYLYTQSGNGESKGTELNKSIKNKNKQLTDANIVNGFDYNLLSEMVRVCKKINIFIWCSRLQILDILKYFENIDCTYDILVWNKTNPIPLPTTYGYPTLSIVYILGGKVSNLTMVTKSRANGLRPPSIRMIKTSLYTRQLNRWNWLKDTCCTLLSLTILFWTRLWVRARLA